MPPVTINNVELIPILDQVYPHNYYEIIKSARDDWPKMQGAIRYLVLNDLFFIVHFIMAIPGSNHPFVIERCVDVQGQLKRLYTNDPNEPRKRLNVSSRYHYKSSIMTIAATIQYHLHKPDECTL